MKKMSRSYSGDTGLTHDDNMFLFLVWFKILLCEAAHFLEFYMQISAS